MSERNKRVFRLLMDPLRDADVIERIESQPSHVGYVREVVRRDAHDERLDYAMLKASELEAENAKLRELVKEMRVCLEDECKRCHEWGDTCDLEHQMCELGIEVSE